MQRITFGGVVIKQPDNVTPKFATTSSEGSGNTIDGVMHNTVLFTKEAYDMEWSDLTLVEMSTILQKVVNKESFEMEYLSAYTGAWQKRPFYVASTDLKVGTWVPGKERWKTLTMTCVGVLPIDCVE